MRQIHSALPSTTTVRTVGGRELRLEGVSQALRQLDRIAQLQPDWDSYGAEAISAQALAAARDLLARLAPWELTVPLQILRPVAVAPLASGGVLLEWRGDRDSIEVEFDRIGAASYLLVHPEGHRPRFEEREARQPSELFGAIARVVLPATSG